MTPGYFDPGDESGLSNLPIYDSFNAVSDVLEWPRASFWMYWILGLSIGFGAIAFKYTGSPIWTIAGVGIAIAYGWNAGVVAFWILLVYVLLAGFLSFIILRGGAESA